jgi:hypothetical protein
MILAKKTGWLISCVLVKEDKHTTTIKPYDQKSNITVDKSDERSKVFDNVYKAIDWIKGE